jgi:predicted dithiol-disulfide oxidoreductase (DUF899 family)
MLDAPEVATRADWLRARCALLEKEKAHLRAGDALAAERRALPWVRVDAPYSFETEAGPRSLADLFDGRSQLVVYHFMFGPGWKQGCDGCSFLADHFDGANLHLQHHDVSLVAVSHTYSTYGRGCNPLIGAHAFLDLTPLGRNENGTMDWVRRHDEYTVG